MSYKNALAGLPLGGGKAVIRRPARQIDRQSLFRAFGRAVADLRGRYVTAEDVGTSVSDMVAVARETSHVAGLPPRDGSPGGDSSPWTARGVFLSMQYAVERKLHRSLRDCTVAIQGVGHVGSKLATMLHEAGARLIIADIDSAAAARVATAMGADVIPISRILAAKADVVAPCALGGSLDDRSIDRMVAKVVCGAANNQLATAEDGTRLADRGVLYAPDYVVNAGGIINVAAEYFGWTTEFSSQRVDETAQRLAAVLDHADRMGLPANVAADDLARRAIARGALLRHAA
jgi:leucine dehydrogenase